MKTCEILATVARVALVGAVAVAVTASASSSSNRGAVAIGAHDDRPPPAQAMDAERALGLWKSSFGAVKVEVDANRPGGVHGVWTYDRNGQQVVGYFAGALRGN